jgi:uncharacterized protein YggU (UPF0235/DUF167 family)
MKQVTQRNGRTILQVTVHTGSARPRVERRDDALHVFTAKKPVQGQANSDVIRLISDYLTIPKNKIRIVKGLKSRNKLISIHAAMSGSSASPRKGDGEWTR